MAKNLEIMLYLPGVNPYSAPYEERMVAQGVYNAMTDSYIFRSSKEAIEDLVKRLKSVGVHVHMKESDA